MAFTNENFAKEFSREKYRQMIQASLDEEIGFWKPSREKVMKVMIPRYRAEEMGITPDDTPREQVVITESDLQEAFESPMGESKWPLSNQAVASGRNYVWDGKEIKECD